MLRKPMAILATAVLGWGTAGRAQASVYTPDEKVVLSFSTNWDTGYVKELFVVGNHPDLGDWNPVAARKLYWTDGNVWTGNVAVTAGNAIEYKYIVRTNSGDVYCNGGNAIWMADPNLATSTPARAGAPFVGKTIYYYSGWTNASLLHRTGSDTNWFDAPMARAGAGRFPGEFLYRAVGVGQTGELLTFVPHGFAAGDPEEKRDNCPIAGLQNYFTRLDGFLLQDGQIYNYWPPTNRTASGIATNHINSSYTPQVPAATSGSTPRATTAKIPASAIRCFIFTTGKMSSSPAGVTAAGMPKSRRTT